MKGKSLAIVAVMFFACTACAVDWPAAGETYTVPANTTNVVSDADIDDYNALGKVVFTDSTSALLFTTDTAPNVPLEGAGWMIKDSTSTGKWSITTQQTTAWVGTWDVRGGEIAMTTNVLYNGLFNSNCADLHDVYIRPGAKVSFDDKANCNTCTKARIFLGGQLHTYTGGNVARLRQIEVTDDDAVMYLGGGSITMFYDHNSSLSYLKLNGHTLKVNGAGTLGFRDGKVVGPGELTINCDRGVTIHQDANGGAATDFMFYDPTVTVKMNCLGPDYPLSNRYLYGNRTPSHPTCPQLAKLVTLRSEAFFEHYHTNSFDCSSITPYIWAGPVELHGDLKLRRVLAPGEDDHFLAFDFKGGLSKDAGTRTIGFDPVVFTNAVVRYHGTIPSGLKHDGFRWDGRFDLASDIELNHMMYLAETNDAVGIVRQQGGSVTLLGGTIFGRNGGYPAYLLEGGTLTFANGSDLFFDGTYTHFRQTGGTFRPYDIHKTAREGDLRTDVVIEGDSQLVKGHYGFRNFRGPICIAVCGNAQADLGWFGNTDAAVQTAMAPHEHIFALNGGFTTMNSYANLTNSYAFNGGTLATTYGQYAMFGREDGKPWVRIYEKGGELRTIDGLRSVNLPALKEPVGNVVWSIALSDELRGKVWQSPPAVYIDDATGSNAVAVVDYDFDSGKVTNITVLCRGENYTLDGATANLYYRAGEKLLENDLVCTTGPCQGFDVTLSSTERAGVFRYLATNAGMTNTFHGTLTVDMDMSKCADYGGTLTNGVTGDTQRYGGSLNLYYSSQVCFQNCTNIVLKSGMIYSVGGSVLSHRDPAKDAFPDCNRIELYGGHLAGGRIEYRETVIGGRIALISHNMVNDAGYLYIPSDGTLYIDAPSVMAGNTPSIEKGRFYFESGAKVKIQNPEALRDLDSNRVLLDLSGTTVSGTIAFEPPEGLENVVSFRWDATAQKLYARKKAGLMMILR